MKTITKTYLRFEKKDEIEFKKWLIEKELSQAKFAYKVGTTVEYINSVIRGKKNVTKRTIELFKRGGYGIRVE